MLNQSDWQLRSIFNQMVSCRFDWSLPYQANNRFRGRDVKGSLIGILTDRSLVKMSNLGSSQSKIYIIRLLGKQAKDNVKIFKVWRRCATIIDHNTPLAPI